MNYIHLTAALVLSVAIAGCTSSGPREVQPIEAPETLGTTSTGLPVEGVNADAYVLGQGDSIAIQVFDEPDLTIDTVVGTSGSINYSYLGDIQVAGKSPSELERFIVNLLQDGFLVNPSVNVSVVEYRPFYINGEVRSPGSYPYQPGLTLDKAIALAGGLTDRASTRKMFVLTEDGSSQDGNRVNFGSPISPGDIITINEGFF